MTKTPAEIAAEKFYVLKEAITEGIVDVRAGRVSEWDFRAFLRAAIEIAPGGRHERT
jgi:hypothetical protein